MATRKRKENESTVTTSGKRVKRTMVDEEEKTRHKKWILTLPGCRNAFDECIAEVKKNSAAHKKFYDWIAAEKFIRETLLVHIDNGINKGLWKDDLEDGSIISWDEWNEYRSEGFRLVVNECYGFNTRFDHGFDYSNTCIYEELNCAFLTLFEELHTCLWNKINQIMR
jgi:hypothetical protein